MEIITCRLCVAFGIFIIENVGSCPFVSGQKGLTGFGIAGLRVIWLQLLSPVADSRFSQRLAV